MPEGDWACRQAVAEYIISWTSEVQSAIKRYDSSQEIVLQTLDFRDDYGVDIGYW